MFKVLLLAVLYHANTGALEGMVLIDGKPPAFETMEECRAAATALARQDSPVGTVAYIRCVEPAKENTTTT